MTDVIIILDDIYLRWKCREDQPLLPVRQKTIDTFY